MCGMPLEDKSNEFCSRKCRIKFNKINELNKIKKIAMNLAELKIINRTRQ